LDDKLVHAFRCGLLIAAVLLSGCGEPEPATAPAAGIDEASTDNVWQKAKLRGVSFRAVGQEPGWLLEITNGKEILLVTDYGQSRTSLPYVEPAVFPEERRTVFSIEAGETTIEIRGETCRDSMSGEEFEVTVVVKRPDRELRGCGRALH
jgi:putative lipoprotein